MLLHGGKGEEVIKSFFNDVYGYYVKVRCFSSLRMLLHLHSNDPTNLVARDHKAVNESIL
jgi:hypothetical protein